MLLITETKALLVGQVVEACYCPSARTAKLAGRCHHSLPVDTYHCHTAVTQGFGLQVLSGSALIQDLKSHLVGQTYVM